MMKTIKIIGYGDVVKFFLKEFVTYFSNISFEIYCRSLPIEKMTEKNIIFREINTYTQDNSPTFFCCSINEAEELQNSENKSSRLAIAIPNLRLVRHFVLTGFFNSGLHFILTNPSELITEYIIRHTNNKNIFALGLSVDLKRYQEILPEFNIHPKVVKFSLIGNHWDSPLINFDHHFPDNNIVLLEKLIRALKKKIKTEFKGFKPPIESGTRALYDAAYSLYHGENLSASGFLEENEAVSGGILNVATLKFTQPKVNIVSNILLLKAINTHKETYLNLIKEMK